MRAAPRILAAAPLLAVAALALTGCSLGGGEDEPPPRELTIISDLPMKDPYGGPRSRAIVAAIKATIEGRARRAGPFRIRYIQSDFPVFDTEEGCTARAQDYAKNPKIVAVIGPGEAACARFLIPALNQASIAAITPNVDYLPGLTHALPGEWDEESCFECSPGKFYPTGVRNFLRPMPTSDTEGRAAAALLDRMDARRVYVFHGAEEPFRLGFVDEARLRRLNIVGQHNYKFESPSYGADAKKLVAARPDAVYLLAAYYSNGAKVINAIRKAGYRGTIVIPLHIVNDAMLNESRQALVGAYFTGTRLPLAALGADARKFVTSLGVQEHALHAIYAAEATNVVLDAIAASDGTRPGVRDAMFKVARDGFIGRISFDANGDVTPQRIAVFRMRDGQPQYRETITIRTGS